ncbi:MAG: glycosyltransferase [Proteobacteria bacterium]|uniref:glycosyltransferase n=1 Tax=Aquabacterium sp. TaxID=1872578 RepID=UPI0035C70485|nr:glycosyltransferase [Pseudomonadota bacterium]
MRVLVVHNAYQQRGGEDSVVASETALLQQHGHAVDTWLRHNDDVAGVSKLSLAAQALWSRGSADEVTQRIARFRPDVVHVHNTLPLVSPSVFWAAHRAGVPVVQTLHNFRLMCPQAMFLREGKTCEDCLGRVPWRGVVRGCYRHSVTQTGVVAATVVLHRGLGTYERAVTRCIALSEFSRRKFIEGGLAPERVLIKPNFVEDAGDGLAEGRRGGLFVGRLSDEKGVGVLLEALRLQPAQARADVEVIGEGEWSPQAQALLGGRAPGFLPVSDILERMKRAAYLLLPSLCGENFPRTLAEAYCCGLPVIASRIGALAELVEDGVTGLLFETGNAADLAARLAWAEAHPAQMQAMGRAARARYEARYTPAANHDRLIEIYEEAIGAMAAEQALRTRS